MFVVSRCHGNILFALDKKVLLLVKKGLLLAANLHFIIKPAFGWIIIFADSKKEKYAVIIQVEQ